MSSAELLEIYGKFGIEVVAAIVHAEKNDGGELSPLLERLNLPTPKLRSAQHEVLSNFIYKYGITFFLKALEVHDPTQVERMKLQQLISTAGRSQTGGKTTGEGEEEKGMSTGTVQPRDRSIWLNDPMTSSTDVREPASQSTAGADWPTTERRSGTDRRKGPDTRRESVELIYKNRRFGGRDRRKAERRAGDPGQKKK